MVFPGVAAAGSTPLLVPLGVTVERESWSTCSRGRTFTVKRKKTMMKEASALTIYRGD